MDNEYKFGDRIAEMLVSKKMRQKDLADYLCITNNTISYWVHGKRKPTLEQFIAMSKFFNVSLDYLTGISDKPFRHPTLFDDLGLNDEAANRLRTVSSDPKQRSVFKMLFESEVFYKFVQMIALSTESDGRG